MNCAHNLKFDDADADADTPVWHFTSRPPPLHTPITRPASKSIKMNEQQKQQQQWQQRQLQQQHERQKVAVHTAE